MSQVIRAEYVSPFYDQSVLHAWMEDKSALVAGAQELAAAFGLQLAASPEWKTDSHRFMVDFYTKEGLYAGRLIYGVDYVRGARSGDMFFSFASPTIAKEKGSSRSGRDERDSKKITGIISAMKKNKEVPTTAALTASYQQALSYCFNSVANKSHRTPTADLSSQEEVALLKLFVGGDSQSAEALRSDLENKYKSYLDRLEKSLHSARAYDRFCKGCTLIGIMPNKTTNGSFYLIGDSQKVENQSKYTLTNVKRYNTLRDSPVAAEAAIMRTYFSGKSLRSTTNNELGVECMDEYFEDIDVSMGYANSGSGTWVAIPKHGV